MKVKDVQQWGTSSEAEADETASLTWRETATSVLKVNVRCLFLNGSWPLPDCWIYHVFFSIVFASKLCNMVEAFVSIYLSEGGLQEITLVLPNTLLIGSGVFKMAFFYSERGRYYGLVRRTDRLTVSQLAASGEVGAAIVSAAKRHCLKLTSAVFAFISLQIVVWFPMPLIAYPGQHKLPFIQIPYNNETEIPIYELSYALQCFSSFFNIFITLGMDCLFAVIMIHVAAQFEILISRIRSLGVATTVMQSKPSLNQHIRNPQTSINAQMQPKEMLEYQDRVTEAHDKMYSDLCGCIETHQQIISFARHMEAVMSPIALTQFAFSVLGACVTLYQATYSEDFNAVFRCAVFLPIPGSQVYLYCWAAHHVMEQSEAVLPAAYACFWVDASDRFKRTLRILMCRTQRPLVLTAGRLYQINRATFLSLVNASYSYYALLGQISKR